MSINFKTITTMVSLVLAASMTSVIAHQTPEKVRVIQYNGDMAAILSKLPSTYNRTIGLEIDPRHPRSTVHFNLQHPTLADVFNAITKSAPIYQWNERGDFVEVVPLSGSSPFLDTPISDFRIDYADEAEAINQLVNLPEVQAAMNAMRLRYRDSVDAGTKSSGKKMSFIWQNVTLRQVLNRMADESGSRFWILHKNITGVIWIRLAPTND